MDTMDTFYQLVVLALGGMWIWVATWRDQARAIRIPAVLMGGFFTGLALGGLTGWL